LTQSVTAPLNGDELTSHSWTVNSFQNPYAIRLTPDEICLLVNFKSMSVEHVVEVWSFAPLVVLSMMAGNREREL
jgi:hypothetical protein